jgi:transposase
MHKRFRTYDLNQVYLLPPSLHDWVPEDHLARFVAAVTAELDLCAIESTYERNDRRGKPAYHPLLLVRLLVYGYAIGMRSSRQIEKATYTDLAFRYLAADQHPDHDTIAAFRQTHLAALGQLFLQTLLLCQKAGLIKLGTIAIDGTKIAANASRQRTRRYERLTEKEQELAATVEKLLAEAQATDQQEDARYGTGRRGDELPAGLATAEGRLARIRAAKQELEREARERAEQAAREKAAQKGKARDEAQRKRWQRARPVPDPEAKANLTDPDSRLMVDGATKAYVQGYNAQVAVDGEAGVIVACAVTQQLNDKQQLTPLVEAVEKNLGARPVQVLADAGYWNEEQVAAQVERGMDVLVPPDAERRKAEEPLAANAPRGPRATAMRERLGNEEELNKYRKRAGMVEPVFGIMKEQKHFRRFLLRGIDKVQAEWSFACATFNLWRMFRRGYEPQMA